MIQLITKTLRDPFIKSIASRGITALFIKVAAAALSFLMFLFFSNAMNQREFGKFAIGFSLAITISMFAGFGLSTAALRFVPQYQATNDQSRKNGFMNWAGKLTLFLPLAFAAAAMLALFAWRAFTADHNSDYLFAALVLFVFMTYSEYLASLLRALGATFMSLAPRDIVWRIAGCAIALVAGWLNFYLDGHAVLITLSIALAAICVWQIWYARSDIHAAIHATSSRSDKTLWLNKALPMWGAATLYALAQQFDVVVVGYFLSVSDAASYFAALRSANMLSLLLIAGNLISAPLISQYHHSGDRAGLTRIVKILSIGITIPTLCGLLVLIAAGQFMLALFNPEFVSAYAVLIILGLGFTFDALAGPTGYMLQMVGEELSYLKIMGAVYAVTLASQCIFAPQYGALGVAVPTALGLMIANILIVLKIRKSLKIDPSIFGWFFKAA